MGRTLPTIALDDIRIASPCDASWEAMKGDDRVRFCGSCQKNVFDLSSMGREDAEALIERTEGRVCVRFYRRRDGTVLTQDCPVGLRAVRRRLAWIGAGLAAGLGLVAAFFGLRRERSTGPGHDVQLMGAVVAPHGPEEVTGRVALPDPQPMMGAPVMHVPDESEARPDGRELLMGELVAPVDTGR